MGVFAIRVELPTWFSVGQTIQGRLTGVAYCLSTPQSRLAGKNSLTTPFNWDLKSWIQQHSTPSKSILLFSSLPSYSHLHQPGYGSMSKWLLWWINKTSSICDNGVSLGELLSRENKQDRLWAISIGPVGIGPSTWNLRVTCRNPSLQVAVGGGALGTSWEQLRSRS